MRKIREWEAQQDARRERKLFMGGGDSGGSSQPTQTTVQQNTIAPEAAPYYSTTLGQAAALTDINKNPYQQYQGNRVAGFDPMQTGAFDQLQGMQLPGQTQAASNTAGSIADQAQNYQGYQTGRFGTASANNAGLMGSYMNPYIQQSLAPTLALMQQQAGINQRTLAQQAQKAGAFGGYRQGIQQAVQGGQDLLAQGNVAGQMYNQGFGQASQNFQSDMARRLQEQQAREQSRQYGAGLGLQGLNTSLQAAGLQGQLGQQQYAQTMGLNQAQQMAGAQRQGLQQQQLNTQYQDFLNQQNWPYKNLSFMSDIIGRPLQNTSTSMYQAPPTPQQSLLGLGLGAYGLSGMMKAKGGTVKKYAPGGLTTLGPVPTPALAPPQYAPPIQTNFIGSAPGGQGVATGPGGIGPGDTGIADSAAGLVGGLTGLAAQVAAGIADGSIGSNAVASVAATEASEAGPSATGVGVGGVGEANAGVDAGVAAANADAGVGEVGGDDGGGGVGGDAGGDGGWKRGGITRFAYGGGVNGILNTLQKLPPQYLQRMQRYQPLTGMVKQSNDQLETANPMPAESTLPPPTMESQGVAQLKAPNMEFADGGIVGFAGGGSAAQERYPNYREPFVASGGSGVIPASRSTPVDDIVQDSLARRIGESALGGLNSLGEGFWNLTTAPVRGLIGAFKPEEIPVNRAPVPIGKTRPESIDPAIADRLGVAAVVPKKEASGKASGKASGIAAAPRRGFELEAAPTFEGPKSAADAYKEMQGIQELVSKDNPLYGRRNELAARYAEEKSMDPYANALVAAQAVISSPHRYKGGWQAVVGPLAEAITAGGLNQNLRNKADIERSEKLLQLDASLREGDMKTASHLQDQITKDKEGYRKLLGDMYHTRQQARVAAYAADLGAEKTVEAARIHAGAISAGAQNANEMKAITQLRMLDNEIRDDATRRVLGSKGVTSLDEIIDPAARANALQQITVIQSQMQQDPGYVALRRKLMQQSGLGSLGVPTPGAAAVPVATNVVPFSELK